MSLSNDSGIYIIRNLITGKCYIGQSVSICRRVLRHKCDMNNNRHYNLYLQRAWNKYGANSFRFDVLEICRRDDLDEKEIMYIQQFNSFIDGYNLTAGWYGHSGCTWFDTERNNLKNAHWDKWIRVVSVNNGEVFDCIGDAAKHYDIDVSSISLCCGGERLSAGNDCEHRIVWMYYDDYIECPVDKIASLIERADAGNRGGYSASAKPVVLLNTGEVFACLRDASDRADTSLEMVVRACTGRAKSAGEYCGEKLVWRYYEDYIKLSKEEVNKAISSANTKNAWKNHFASKPVILVNTGERFDCMAESVNRYGLSVRGISQCCTGAKKSSGRLDGVKMVWQYAC